MEVETCPNELILTGNNKSNKVSLFIKEEISNNTIKVYALLDNLLKGSAGAAIQNMNLMFGFNETEGLK